MLMRAMVSSILLMSLAACSMAPNDHAQGGLTAGENERLEAAARQIDDRTPSPARPTSDRFEQGVRQQIANERGER